MAVSLALVVTEEQVAELLEALPHRVNVGNVLVDYLTVWVVIYREGGRREGGRQGGEGGREEREAGRRGREEGEGGGMTVSGMLENFFISRVPYPLQRGYSLFKRSKHNEPGSHVDGISRYLKTEGSPC